MSRKQKESFFWTSYSDLMTSMFFVMLVLFVLCLSVVQYNTKDLIETKAQLEEALKNANAEKEQLERILQLDSQFAELSKSSALEYVEDKKMFVARDLLDIEIFKHKADTIKPEYLNTVDDVGKSLEDIVKRLHEKQPEMSFQLVIEGNAAIKYENLKSGQFDPDCYEVYDLSYRRALALYMRWKQKGIDLRKYNTEVIIAGSGFNGKNRDMRKEDNNKRFVIQIIPKISRPKQPDLQ